MKRLVVWVVGLIALVQAGQAAAWSWPTPGPVLRPFSFGDDPYAAGQHRGIDIGSDAGAGVVAPASGTVTFAGSVPGGGKTISIRTDDGRYSVSLLHLGSISVGRGAVIDEGSVVGTVDVSGDPAYDRPYLYLGVRIASDPQGYIDPLSVLPPLATEPAAPADEAPAAASPEAAPASAEAAPAGDDPAAAPEPESAAEPIAAPEPVPAAAASAPEAASPVTPAVEAASQPSAASAPAAATAASPRTARTRPAGTNAAQPVAPTSVPAGVPVVDHPQALAAPPASEAPKLGRIVAAPHVSRARVDEPAGGGPVVTRVSPPRAAAPPLPPAIPAPLRPKPDARLLASPAPLTVAIPAAARRLRAGAPIARDVLLALLALVVGAVAPAVAFLLRRRPPGPQEAERAPRTMGPDATDAPIEADPGRAGLAVCERATTHRTRRGLRRACRRPRPVSPSPRQPRPHGQRDGRAWHTGDGGGGRRGGVAA